jgi:dephospho-CoA kinase
MTIMMPSITAKLPRFCQRFCIGLTGGIASGKSTVAEYFARLGAAIVDTDVIAHQLTTAQGEAMPAIASTFGTAFINADGSLNRAAMRKLVFANPNERQRLEAILHPLIHTHTQNLGATTAGCYVVFVVPLLVEQPQWRKQVDRFTVVDCEPEIQKKRLLQRAGITTLQADQIMEAQAKREHRLAVADDILHNTLQNTQNTLKNHTNLITQINILHTQYLQQANTPLH